MGPPNPQQRGKYMSKVRFLNLDEVTPEAEVVVTIDGQDHKMVEMSVSDFLWAQKRLADLEDNKDEMSPVEMLQVTVDVLCRQFPTVKREQFERLGLTRLNKLVQFTQETAAKGAEDAVAEQVKEGNVEMEPEAPTV